MVSESKYQTKQWRPYHAKSLQSCLTLRPCGLYSRQAPLSMEFSRQEYWSGLPWPPPGDLPNPGIESVSHCRRIPYHLSHQGSSNNNGSNNNKNWICLGVILEAAPWGRCLLQPTFPSSRSPPAPDGHTPRDLAPFSTLPEKKAREGDHVHPGQKRF